MTSETPLALEAIPDRLQKAGVAGAGGAGFPSYIKWNELESIEYLLINHQESEPNYYADKWLARERAEHLGRFLKSLVGTVFEAAVIGTKRNYREEWTRPLERATDATVRQSTDLPLDVPDETGIVVAYTPDVYTYSEESTLLTVTAGAQIGDDLPTEHGWIVHNTESLYNICNAVRDGTPVTRKYVHVDGNTPRHRCLDVPLGTPATSLLKAAGREQETIASDEIIADGGPGWCYEIDLPPEEFGVRKRTNGVLVLDEELARRNRSGEGEIDVLEAKDWGREHETAPTRLDPDRVRIPLITNRAYEGLVEPSMPTVDVGDVVSTGDVIAHPASAGLSNTQHASIDGRVEAITEYHIEISSR